MLQNFVRIGFLGRLTSAWPGISCRRVFWNVAARAPATAATLGGTWDSTPSDPGWRRYSEPGARASCPITTFHSRWLHGQLETRRSEESLRDPFQCIVSLCPGSSGNTPDTVIVDPGFSTGRPKALQNQVFEIFEPRDSPMGSPWTSGGKLEEKASHHDLPSGHNPGRVSSVGLKC